MIGPIIVLIAGIVFAACSSDDSNPQPLPGHKDGGKDSTGDAVEGTDGGVDGTEEPNDAGTDVLVEEDAAQYDGGVQEDAAAQDDAAVQEDAAQGDGAISDASQQNDAGAGQDASVQQSSYECLLTTEDKYGVKYGMYLTTKNPVAVNVIGSWSGDVQFTGASGTDAVLENARRNEKAFTWPHAGQSVASFAMDLTGTYKAEFQRLTGTEATFKLMSYLSNGVEPTILSSRAVLPVTWTSAVDLPEPIASDTSNEFYVSMDVPLVVGGNCYMSSVCENFMGAVTVSDTTWPSTIDPANKYSSISVNCEQN